MVGPESMARGRAVIGFRTGGIPDWLEDNVSGLLVEPGNIKAYAAAIDKLLSNKEMAISLGQSAAELAKDRFKHNMFLKNLIQSLESVL
jgi:glycosyltransferase involved in cell wall biosynthesis